MKLFSWFNMSHRFLLSTATKVPWIITLHRYLLVLEYAIRVPCHRFLRLKAPERRGSLADQKLIQDFGPSGLHPFYSRKEIARHLHVPPSGTAGSVALLRRRASVSSATDYVKLRRGLGPRPAARQVPDWRVSSEKTALGCCIGRADVGRLNRRSGREPPPRAS
jgi:hypothetical protein